MQLRIYRIDSDYTMGDEPEAEAVNPVIQCPMDRSNIMRVVASHFADTAAEAEGIFNEYVRTISGPQELVAGYLDERPWFLSLEGQVTSGLADLRSQSGWPTLPLKPLGDSK